MTADRHHPIIDAPWTYHLTDFRCHSDPAGIEEPFVELTLDRAGEVRRLRFLGPQKLQLDGFPSASSLCILDIKDRQLEGLQVEVLDFDDQVYGVPRFYARSVVDLDSDIVEV